MANMTIPTSRDIYLELNGKKLAVVQGYSAKALRTSREVEAFGESEPVATVAADALYARAQPPVRDGRGHRRRRELL